MVGRSGYPRFKLKAGLLALLSALIYLAGCGSVATKKDFYDPITAELRNGNYDLAAQKINQAGQDKKYGHKDRFIFYIDAGLACHYAGLVDTSNALLTMAEDAADELFTKSVSRAAVSVLLNDNVLEYSGEDYEILYTNLFKALNYISQDRIEEAFVEIRRADNKLNLLEDKYAGAAARYNQGRAEDTIDVDVEYAPEKVRFNNDAFARYLSMHMYANDGKWDDAGIDYNYLKSAFREQPYIYNFPVPEVKYNPRRNMAILSIVGMAGLSPVKEALNLRLRTDKDLNLVQILYTDPEKGESEYGHIPMEIGEDFYMKFAIPQIVSRPSVVSGIRIYADSVLLGELQLIEDVGMVARETFNARKSLIYFRTVIRAVAKGIVAYKAKKKADSGGLFGWLKKAAIDVTLDISENADLRCSRLMPGRIYIGDFEIAPGRYDLKFEFLDQAGHIVDIAFVPGYEVLGTGLNMIEIFSLK